MGPITNGVVLDLISSSPQFPPPSPCVELHQRGLSCFQAEAGRCCYGCKVSSAEATAREDVFEAEASAREQLKMMETLGRRMEEGILREQFQQQRLERLEQLDHAIGMALIKQHTQYNLTKSVTLVQAHARAYLSGKRTELKHVERYFRGAKTQLASTPLASNPLRRRSSAPRSASEPVHVLWPHEQPHTPYQQHFVMPLEQGPTTGLYQPSHEQSPSGAMYFDANRPYHASQPLQPLVLMPYYSNPGDRPRCACKFVGNTPLLKGPDNVTPRPAGGGELPLFASGDSC